MSHLQTFPGCPGSLRVSLVVKCWALNLPICVFCLCLKTDQKPHVRRKPENGKEISQMKFFCSLSVLAVLATFASSPALLSAQAVSPTLAEASVPALPFYAQLAPLASSSSSSNAFLYNAPAQASTPTHAAASEGGTRPFSSLGIGVKIGLGGIGFDVATPLVPGHLNIRGGAGFFTYTYNGTVDNEPISATLNLNNAEAMVDWFPFKGSFRLSAGTTVYNQTGLNGSVTVAPGTTLTIGNNSYLSAPSPNQLTGNLSAGFGSKAVPRFTLGWGNMVAKNHRIRFESEFGVEIIGTPTVAWNYGGEACLANSAGNACATGSTYQSINSVPGATTNINTQIASLQSDVNNVKIFPIFSIGLSVKLGKK